MPIRGRVYTVQTQAVTVSAAQDLAQIKGAAGKLAFITRVEVNATDTSAPTSQELSFRIRFLPATVTDGSGGTTPTPQKTDNGDAAASFTALCNNTTPATTSGTASQGWSGGCNILSGLDYSPPKPFPIGPSESGTVELLSTVSGTVHLSITITVEEMGG